MYVQQLSDSELLGLVAQRDEAASSLRGWHLSHGVPVAGYTVQLIAFRANGSTVWIHGIQAQRDGVSNFRIALSQAQLRQFIGRSTGTVAALVTQDDPLESSTQYSPYELRANGTLQRGGGNLQQP